MLDAEMDREAGAALILSIIKRKPKSNPNPNYLTSQARFGSFGVGLGPLNSQKTQLISISLY